MTKTPLALIAGKKHWHLVRDLGYQPVAGRAVSLCGRVYQTSDPGWILTSEPQHTDDFCGHCCNVRLGIRDGRSALAIAYAEEEARDVPT